MRAAKEELEKEIKKLVSNYRFIQNHGKCKIFYLYAWETTLRSLMCEPQVTLRGHVNFFKFTYEVIASGYELCCKTTSQTFLHQSDNAPVNINPRTPRPGT